MPKGPPVTEIFSPLQTAQSDQPHSRLSSKKTFAPMPPMKKFGGYKPKILGDTDGNVVPIHYEQNNSRQPSQAPRRSPIKLTQPKPFIIGDKDTPMTLSSFDDADDNGNTIDDKMEEMHIYEEPSVYHQTSEMSYNRLNNANKNIVLSRQHPAHTHPYDKSDEKAMSGTSDLALTSSDVTSSDDEKILLEDGRSDKEAVKLSADNPAFSHGLDAEDSGLEQESESDGYYIPEPDYDEEEQTLDFAEEDPDELLEEEKQKQRELERQQRMREHKMQVVAGVKVYHGEDLSRYLSEDDEDSDDFITPGTNAGKKKSSPVRLNPKHSMFKQKSHHNTTGKRKSSKSKAPAFNSVRNFSFADSKYGTNGKSDGKKMSFTEFTGDHDSFLTTSHQGEGYETFLRSKHGVSRDTYESDLSFPQWKQADRSILKKLTVRLKHKRKD